ncbi:hypothetical protein [Streptomyces sp. NPDC006274]|uniref:hypothetical protein n=1 Tax=unclassified Streptomyces TaxID=2593676 RepID=UPI0033BC41D8
MAVVAATPADAVSLLEAEHGDAVVHIVCLRSGDSGDLDMLRAELSAIRARGCRIPEDPCVIEADERSAPRLIREALREIRPTRLRTHDPDPVHDSFDREKSMVVINESALRRGSAARAALKAAREHQLAYGTPVFVECRREGTDGRPEQGAASRYPTPARWLVRAKDGRISAYLPSAAGVVRWTEGATGSGWSGPELLEGPRLMPGLTVVQDADGYTRLFALRRRERTDGDFDVDVVCAIQYQTGRPIGPWHSLGNPNAGDWARGREVGFPVAVLDGEGRLHVFVRNFGHSLSTRSQDPSSGKWTPWKHLSGLRVADEAVAYQGWNGGVELFARARDSVAAVRWELPVPGGEWSEDRAVPVSPLPGSLSAAPEVRAVRYRYARTNEICLWQPGGRTPLGLGGADGAGQVMGLAGADVQGWGYTVLIRSGGTGACAIGAHADGRPDLGVWWSESGDRSLVPPAATFDAQGRVVIATLGADGRVRICRQQLCSEGLEFTAWDSL